MPLFTRKPKTNKPRSVWQRKRTWAAVFSLGTLALLASCSSTRMMMQTAPSTPKGDIAQPPIVASSLEQWESRRTKVWSDLQNYIYGPVPTELSLKETSAETINGTHFGGTARLETRQFLIMNKGEDTGRNFGLVIVTPVEQNKAVPVIIMQNFCPNHDVIPHPEITKPDGDYFSCAGGGMINSVFTYFFGRYITTPPIQDIMTRGYALAVMYPSEFVPDNSEGGRTVLNTLFADQGMESRIGAIAAWAAQFSLISDYVEDDPAYSKQIAYGHSRYGKSALLAAAFDPNIDAVIAHQSGTGGASLSRDKPGETVADITAGYPHWFTQTYADYAARLDELPIDQHHLLALMAPRPILLGNAKRDVWSDPNGAFRAAQGATPVYGLYGKNGLRQPKLTAFDPEADIAFWIRSGTHGVVKEDWPAFLDFLDAHLK